MITTIYKCDRCKKEQTVPKQMWEIGIRYRSAGGLESADYAYRVKECRLWCRSCCDDLQIINALRQEPDKPVPAVVTFEEQLREIIREEIEAATGRQ